MLCLLSSALAWHWRGAGSHVAISRMARTVTSWGWVMPCCHWLPGEIAAAAAAVWHFSSGPLKGGDAILPGSLPGCILPPTWPWNQAELEHPCSATVLAPAPAVIALSHLHRPASSFFSLSSRSPAPHHHGLPPPATPRHHMLPVLHSKSNDCSKCRACACVWCMQTGVVEVAFVSGSDLAMAGSARVHCLYVDLGVAAGLP